MPDRPEVPVDHLRPFVCVAVVSCGEAVLPDGRRHCRAHPFLDPWFSRRGRPRRAWRGARRKGRAGEVRGERSYREDRQPAGDDGDEEAGSQNGGRTDGQKALIPVAAGYFRTRLPGRVSFWGWLRYPNGHDYSL